MTIAINSISSEAQEQLGQLFGKELATDTETESTAVEEVENLEVEGDADEVTDEEGDDEADLDNEEPQTSEPDIEYIKANGKKVKIDFNDRDNIKRVYSLAAGARQWQSERDDYKAKYEAEQASGSERKETMDYLESIKDDHEELFEAVTGTSLNDKFNEWAEEQNMITGMTDKEKSMYLSNQDHQKRIRDVEKREKELQAKLDDVGKKDAEAEQAKQRSIANPIFYKYNFDGELGNDQLEHRMNKALWSEAREELAAFDNVTPDMVEETFNRISNQIRGGFKSSANMAVKKTVAAKRNEVKKKAQAMAVAKPKDNLKSEIDAKLKAGDIAGILAGGYDLSSY